MICYMQVTQVESQYENEKSDYSSDEALLKTVVFLRASSKD